MKKLTSLALLIALSASTASYAAGKKSGFGQVQPDPVGPDVHSLLAEIGSTVTDLDTKIDPLLVRLNGSDETGYGNYIGSLAGQIQIWQGNVQSCQVPVSPTNPKGINPACPEEDYNILLAAVGSTSKPGGTLVDLLNKLPQDLKSSSLGQDLAAIQSDLDGAKTKLADSAIATFEQTFTSIWGDDGTGNTNGALLAASNAASVIGKK